MLLLFLSHLLSRNLLISDELFITKDLGVRKAQLEEVLWFIIPIPKHDTLQYGFQSRNNKQRYNIRNNLILIFYSSLCIYKYKNRSFILQSVHLLYKYAIRINLCFIRSIRIHLSAYEYIFEPTNNFLSPAYIFPNYFFVLLLSCEGGTI
jgi:hypothetical protein